jgi:hypothetical protein
MRKVDAYGFVVDIYDPATSICIRNPQLFDVYAYEASYWLADDLLLQANILGELASPDKRSVVRVPKPGESELFMIHGVDTEESQRTALNILLALTQLEFMYLKYIGTQLGTEQLDVHKDVRNSGVLTISEEIASFELIRSARVHYWALQTMQNQYGQKVEKMKNSKDAITRLFTNSQPTPIDETNL